MLEYWYKEKRSLVDFRRGPLGPHFDAFAAYLKTRGFSKHWGKEILGKCCQFNAFLIERGIVTCAELNESLIDPFLDLYLANSRTAHLFRIPVIPKVNDSASDAQAFAHLMAEYGIEEVELVPFHQYGKGKYADLGRDYGFAQNRSLSEADVARFRARLERLGVKTSVSG